jgi:predicted RNase H-like nuclease (RuvC/YqgF family)
MTEVEMKKEQLAKMVKFGLIGLFCAVAAPVAWLAVTGIAGMLVAVGVGIVGWNLAPVLALKAANLKYRALDAEKVSHIVKVQEAAAENPIETIQLQYEGKVKNAQQFAESITVFRTEIKNYEGTVKEFEAEYPEDAQAGREQLAFMRENLKTREDRYAAVQGELEKLAATIRKMRALWKLALATQKMNKLAGMNTGDEFARIKTEAAVDSVMSNVNKAFAEMETAVMVNRKPAQAALMNNPQPVLTIDNVTQKVTV